VVPLTAAHIQFSKDPRHKLALENAKSLHSAASQPDAVDEVYERGLEAAMCLSVHGHEGVAGIFPVPLLGDLCHVVLSPLLGVVLQTSFRSYSMMIYCIFYLLRVGSLETT
jgi:hypothetical protein